MFESLLKRTWDEPFSLYGSIAASVEVPDDRSWVAFTLRPEARWHDGSPITADDVVFSFETLRDQGRPNHRLFYGKVAHIERPDPRTVKFVFGPEGDHELPLIMGLMPIISKAYYTAADFTKSTLEPPLGNGPYRIESVDPGRSIVYRRVTDYWARDLPINRGHYNFERVRYDYYRDSTVLMEAFTSGDYDLRREGSAVRWATAYGIPAVADGRVKRELLPHRRPAGMRAFVFNTRRALFADRRVREALGFAFDFEWLNENLLHGAYVRTDSYFANSELASRGAPSVREQALLTPYRGRLADEVFTRAFVPPATDGTGNVRENLKAARALLGEAGWRVREGALRDGASRAFAFEIMLVRPDNERIALAYVRNLERLGISARVRTVDTAQYEARRRAYDYDMIIHRWGVTLSPGNEQAYYWGSGSGGARGHAQLRRHQRTRDRRIDRPRNGGARARFARRRDSCARPRAALGTLRGAALSPDERSRRLLGPVRPPAADAALRIRDRDLVARPSAGRRARPLGCGSYGAARDAEQPLGQRGVNG